jgi:osmotically-inducible protein OsmY
MSQDSDLQRAVLDELGWEPRIDSAHIGVAADSGVVTLTGQVQSYAQKLAAEKAAARVKGVKALVEELEVRLPYAVRRNDEDIAQAALDSLSWDGALPQNSIKIKVEKGLVILTGSVDWKFQKDAAAAHVHGLLGVVSVSNQIAIEPNVSAANVSADITQALHRSWFYDPNSIRVTAEGGVIKLTGEVTTWNARDLAGSTAWSAPGATAVQNDISVKS